MSYNEPPPPPPAYGGQPGYGAAQPQKNSVMAIIALVTSILGVIPCFWGCFVFSIAGVVLGILGKKEIRESNGAKKGAGLAQWGFILGIVGIVISVLIWVLFAAGAFDFEYYGDLS